MNIKELFTPKIKTNYWNLILFNKARIIDLLGAAKLSSILDIEIFDVDLIEALKNKNFICNKYKIKPKGNKFLLDQSSVYIVEGDKNKNSKKVPYKSLDRVIYKNHYIATSKYEVHQGQQECMRRLIND